MTPARVLWRHWPGLVGLAVAGVVARAVLVKLAVVLAGLDAVLGFVVFLLAPLAVLAALVLMRRTVAPSLAQPGAAPKPPLRHLGGPLVVFLGFYAGFGLLAEDMRAYRTGCCAGTRTGSPGRRT
jgi:hypothetical protein